jgi:hypothetical protein
VYRVCAMGCGLGLGCAAHARVGPAAEGLRDGVSKESIGRVGVPSLIMLREREWESDHSVRQRCGSQPSVLGSPPPRRFPSARLRVL